MKAWVVNEQQGTVIGVCDDIPDAEILIEMLEAVDPVNVHAGNYGIAADEEAETAYQQPPRREYGDRDACRYCGQDIEFHGREVGWIDRGGGRGCLPYEDRKQCVMVHPKTKHAPPRRTP